MWQIIFQLYILFMDANVVLIFAGANISVTSYSCFACFNILI